MTEQDKGPKADPGHLLPADEWERVKAEAEAAPPVHELKGEHRRTLGRGSFPSVIGFITAKYGGGQQTPTFGVIHSAETPLAPGYALSISNYFTRNTNETSAHFMLGPDATFQLRDTNLVAWHCGNGNTRSIGVEQTGYAGFTRDQWLTGDGLAQLHRLAQLLEEIARAHGIGAYLMDDATLLAAYRGQKVGGWATHDQCRRVLGGTSHTDPMPNFPFDVLGQILGGQAPPPPPPPPAGVGFSGSQMPGWVLPRGHYLGDIRGPAQSHGGDPRYDGPEVRACIEWVQRLWIAAGLVPGVPASQWRTSGWADGKWDAAYSSPVCRAWFSRYRNSQPIHDQVWSDDYAVMRGQSF